jgi:hypothetical protein
MKNGNILGATADISLPNLGIKKLQARVDTGAASCALHASSITIIEDEEGVEQKLEVILFDTDSELYTGEVLEFEDFVIRNVRNSFGKKMARPMIKTTVIINKQSYEILIGFSNRSKLTYDMLIGRNLLEKGFVVDVTK